MSETETADPAAGFAAMMSRAAEQAAGTQDEAPYGYTRDRETGEMRPKKSPGRGGRTSPPVEELKERAAQEAEQAPAANGDRPPDARAGRRRGNRAADKDKVPAKAVEWHEGQIARGVNKLYRKAGKIIKVMDPDVGAALISITRKDLLDNGQPDPDDVTVGEAWEDLARTNPRIRRFLLKIIAGGAWGQLFMVHAPVLLAILMKDAIRKHIPFGRLIEAFLSDDSTDGEVPAQGTVAEGLTMPDFAQMQAMAEQMARQVFERSQAASAGMPRTPEPPWVPGEVVPDPRLPGT